MNKRQRKKRWKNFVYGKGRKGCEYCSGPDGVILRDKDNNWIIGLSLWIEKVGNKDWRLKVKEIVDSEKREREEICQTRIRYCWNCGRRLK